MVTREKRAQNLRRDGGMEPSEIDAIIELYVVMLQHHKICGGMLIKVDLLNKGLQTPLNVKFYALIYFISVHSFFSFEERDRLACK